MIRCIVTMQDSPRHAPMSPMKNKELVLALAVLGLVDHAAAQSAPDRMMGSWQGSLATGTASLRLGLLLERDSTNALRATLISIDQGNARIPGTVTFIGDTLVVAMGGAGAQYRATLNARGDSLLGTFTQGSTFVLGLKHVAVIGADLRPQDPKPPFPYRTKDVSFESAPGVRIAGTVVIPQGAGPFPAVVFVTGSGPQNRDEEIMGHRPFAVIADYLARRGIASLRTDDRGIARSSGVFATATSADFSVDAEAAVRFLRAESDIDKSRVGIIGHSEGGMIGPLVASRTRDVAFLVLLAGPGVPGDSILMLQSQLLGKAAGTPEKVLALSLRFNREIYDIGKSSADSVTALARIRPAAAKFAAEMSGTAQAPDATVQNIVAQTGPLLSPWYRYFLRYDPRPVLRQVHVPVLALNGTLDLQVPYREDLDAIKRALNEGGNTDVTIVEFPGLNHLFQTAQTGQLSEYSSIAETISPPVLDRIARWILAHAKR